MPTGYSEGVSTVSVVDSGFSAGSNRSVDSSRRHEANGMYKLLKKETSHSGSKATVAIVRPETFALLDSKLQTPWWKFWKSKAGVFVTTPEWLQRTINYIEDAGRCQELTFFVSKKIDEIEFAVDACIHALNIVRCHHHPRSRSRLLIKGSSTFSSVRLDEWQAKRHRHALYLGEGIGISVDMADRTAWADSVASLPEAQREQVYGHFLCMKQDAGAAGAEGPWWDGWKRHMAIVVGFLSGVGAIAPTFEVSAEGCYVEYRFGAPTAVASTKPHHGSKAAPTVVVHTAAGPAGLLKAGVPAPIYFIKWDSLLKWVRGALSVVCSKYWSVLDRLLSWMGGRSTKYGGLEEPRPVRPSLSRAGSSQTGKHVSWKGGRGTTVSHVYVGDFEEC
ncbi:hypothetical protein SLS62_000412 [Diatrype stigma]|uniref:Uncharacterized protein n=1 Tax=Diatrype stigma TaxID=117547 RepID=A0AAN9YXG9_9PEZI